MKIKFILFCVCLFSCIFLFSSVSASDVNGTVAVENVSQIEIADGNVEFNDLVSEDSAVPYHESYLRSNVKDSVLMGQSVGSLKNSTEGFLNDVSFINRPSFDVNVYTSLSVDTYNVLADNETSKTIIFAVDCNHPLNYEKSSIEIYKDDKIFYKTSFWGRGVSIDLPMGLYNVVFKSDYPNLSKVTCDISVTDGRSFYDLKRTIDRGKSEIVLDRDYTYNPHLDTWFKNGIVIGKSLTINGNGHTIDAKNKLRIFDVVSDDVIISNLTLLNGYVVDCGGALLWEANNGVISNVHFINDTSLHVGGAIGLDGKNIILDRLQFENSSAGWTDDLIYLGHNFENATLLSCNHDDLNRIVDGRKVNLTLSGSPIPMTVLGCPVDISKYVFDILAFGGNRSFEVNSTFKMLFGKTLHKTRNISYFGQLVNRTDFILTFYESLGDVYITEDLSFTGVANTSGLIGDVVLNKMRNGEFNATFTYLKYVTIKDKDEYENAVSLKAEDVFAGELFYYSQVLNELEKDHVSCIKGLGVNFVKTLNIDSDSSWNPKKMGFDSIYIDGNNSVINGNSGKRDSNIWADISEGYVFTACNITIKKFNNAFYNDGGFCILKHVTATENKMKYMVDRDWGAGLLNAGLSICTDCIFTNNYCCCGGAIFNQGILTLNNCSFKGNDAYRTGDTVLNVDKAKVYLDGIEINGSSGPIKHVNSISSGFEKFLKSMAVIVSFIGGAIGGAATSPAGGAAIGAGVGFVVGGLTSMYINAHHYDIHYNRLKATLLLTGICALAGAAGGLLGGYAAQYTASPGTYGGMVEGEFSLNPSFDINIDAGYECDGLWGEGYNQVIHELPNIVDVFIQ